MNICLAEDGKGRRYFGSDQVCYFVLEVDRRQGFQLLSCLCVSLGNVPGYHLGLQDAPVEGFMHPDGEVPNSGGG